MVKFYPTGCSNSYKPCPPSTSNEQNNTNCLEKIEQCNDIYLRQGESWTANYHLLMYPYLQLKTINPGLAGTASFTLNGICHGIVAGDTLSLFNTCGIGCKSLEGCYTVVEVVDDCAETIVTVAEEILGDCPEPIQVGGVSTGGYFHPSNGCDESSSYDAPPMLAKILPNLDSVQVIGKITNSQTLRKKDIEVWANSGLDYVYICPNVVQCYDVINVPQLGIVDAQVVHVSRDPGGYQKVTLEVNGEPYIVTGSGSCVKGTVQDGVISQFQYTPTCDGLVVSLPAESSLVDSADGALFVRGTEDFSCVDSCEETELCEPREFAYYTVAVKYLTEDGVITTQILSNGVVYLTNTSLSI